MPLFSASIDVFLLTSIALIASWSFLAIRNPTRKTLQVHTLLNIFVLLHTLSILYTLVLRTPPNIFTRLGIPLTTSSDIIRQTLLKYASPEGSLPKHLDTLVKRLSSFDARNIYVRFGQSVLQDCEYCRTYDEYALYALPRPLLSYIRETAVAGLLTISGTHKEQWRMYAIGTIVCAAVTEGYWVSTVQIKIPRDGLGVVMWHDTLWTYRHILFLLLPIILQLLPSHPPQTNAPIASLPSTLQHLEASLTRIHLLKFTHGSIMRNPQLRDRSGEWWEQERREGEWGREDETVKRLADKLGLGYDCDGKLKSTAKIAVESLKNGFRSEDL